MSTAAPVFMYMYVIHVAPSLGLAKNDPAFLLLRDYLRRVDDYVAAFADNKIDPAEAVVMHSLCEMVKDQKAWDNVREVIQSIVQ